MRASTEGHSRYVVNTDGPLVVTKHQAEMYLCRYCAKQKENLGARATLFDVLDDTEQKKQDSCI